MAESLLSDHATLAREAPFSGDEIENARSRIVFDKDKYKYSESLERLVSEIRIRHHSIRTEKTYLSWVIRFFRKQSVAHVSELAAAHITEFLEYLVLKRNVAANTQSVALNALVFFYKNVLEYSVDDLGDFVRSKKPRRLPVVLTRKEVEQLLDAISHPVYALMTKLLYGSGMRLMECDRLRVQGCSFAYCNCCTSASMYVTLFLFINKS